MDSFFQEICPHVYWIVTSFMGIEVDLYLIKGERIALIDTGVAGSVEESIIPALASLRLGLKDLDLIINTHAHFDHIGGNAGIRQVNPDARIMLHQADESFTRGPQACVDSRYDICRIFRLFGREDHVQARLDMLNKLAGSGTVVDEWLGDGDDIDLGSGIRLKVIHTPGHTRGCICLYWEQERLLFCGDSVQGRGLFPGWLPFYFHAREYHESMKRLSELPVKTLCLGHPVQTFGKSGEAVRRGESAAYTLKESLLSVETIEKTASELAGSEPESRDILPLSMKVIKKLQYKLPVILHQDFGVPVNSLATIMAHLENKIDDIFP